MRTKYNLTPRLLQDCIPANSQKFSVNCTTILDAYARLPDSVAVLTSIDEVCAWIGIAGIHTQVAVVFGTPTGQNWQLHSQAKREFQIKTVEEHHGMKILSLFLLRCQAQQFGE